MADAFDRIVIAVPDLPAAVAEYEALLGRDACVDERDTESDNACFPLANTVIELCRRDVPAPVIDGLVLRDVAARARVRPVANRLDLLIGVSDGSRSAALSAPDDPDDATRVAVDHLVLRTKDADACIAFFADEMGLRLALDKTVPEWGGRMLFFRAGKMTLEVIESQQDPVSDNAFWGIAYQHADLDAACAALERRGVAHSAVRDGRKPGTRVATVKSHTLGIPTLLIEPST